MAHAPLTAEADAGSTTITALVESALSERADTGHALDAFTALAARLGFDGFTYLRIGRGTATPELLAHWTTAAPHWVAHYAARGYHLVDPRVTRTQGRSVPIAWDDTCTSDPHAHVFIADAGRYAIRSGVAMAMLDCHGGRVVVCWDSSATCAGATRGVAIRRELGTIALLGGIVHEAMAARCAAATRAHGQDLTRRERECLTLAARGLTSCDIAQKLGITERTANFHIGNILAKFGALNRGEAIARAVALNLVSPSH